MRFFALLALIISFNACSPGYVIQAAYEQSKILLHRRAIAEVLDDKDTSSDERRKLAFVVDARLYAEKIGLQPGKSFTTYTKVDKDVLAWVVAGCRRDSFTIKTWWFPVVGSVPYKGYFSEEDARGAARDLENDGFETFVRGTEAFSTLGWFNDPVLTPTLKHHETRVVNTVIHETVHTTIWIPGSVPFNESLANFVGTEGAVDFFTSRIAACPATSTLCPDNGALLAIAQSSRTTEYEFADAVTGIYEELDALYKSNRTTEEKLSERETIFAKRVAPLKAHYPTMRSLQKMNNAEILQLVIYSEHLQDFKAVLEKHAHSWELFLQEMRDIRDTVQKDSSKDPFAILKEKAAP